MAEIYRSVVVAPIEVRLVPRRVVEKRVVDVALVVVALIPVKSCKVEEPVTKRLPNVPVLVT